MKVLNVSTILAPVLLLMVSFSVGEYSSVSSGNIQGDIVFSHAMHAEGADIECLMCHEHVETSNQADDDLFPSMDFCGNCHDIEDMDACRTCHRNVDEPGGYATVERSLIFSHTSHFSRGLNCNRCHGDIGHSDRPDTTFLPSMIVCFDCHDGSRADDACGLCHGDDITLADIHPTGWRHSHGDTAPFEQELCNQCHKSEVFCIDCHRGDNILGNIHDLNYVYTHGLDAGGKESDCSACHDRGAFCVDCHENENRIPLLHSTLDWIDNHGSAARRDPENCAACHEADSPTCALTGCHHDSDGLRGTDPRIHSGNMALLDSHGPWHGDSGYFCYQCHVFTGVAGDGFCGYCHH